MKKLMIITLCFCFTLSVTACSQYGNEEIPAASQNSFANDSSSEPSESETISGFSASSSDEESAALSDQDETTNSEQSKTVPLDAIRNSAVDKIGSLIRMPDEAAGAVQSYVMQMGWMEANQITNLERYTPITGGEYFLIVPQYVNSTVLVESLDWTGSDVPKIVAVTYHKEGTPDDYALVLDTTLPEGIPVLRVTISYGEINGTYSFLYDGRGEPLSMMDNGIYRTEYAGFTKPNTSNPVPTPADNPGFQSGAGTHDRSGVFFVENNPNTPDKARRVDYVVKLPYEWIKEFKYPDSEYAQYFFTGEYLVRFEGYYWDGSTLTEHLNYPDTAETVTLGTKNVYMERLRSGDSVFAEYLFAVEGTDFYVKVVLAPYLHSLDDPSLIYTQTLNELDEEVRLMIASFSVTKQALTQRPF